MQLYTEPEIIGTYTINNRHNDFNATKQTLILVHGVGVSSAYYEPLAQELSTDYNIFVPDLPGYGNTPKPPQALSIEELAKVVFGFIEIHNLNDVTLVGHSMGCQIISHLYHRHPGVVKRLILLSPTANKYERHIALQGLRLLQDTFFEPLTANAVIFSDYLRMGVIRFYQTSLSMIAHHIEKDVFAIDIPTYIVRGEKDYIVPARWIRFLRTQSSNISVNTVVGAAHAFHFTHAPQVAELCRTFIQK